MSLHTELGLTGAYDYKDASPTALPGGLSGFSSRSTSIMPPALLEAADRGAADSIHKTLNLEPEETVIGPGMRIIKRWFVLQAHPVSTSFVNVQIKRHMIFSQRFGKHQAVFHRNDGVLESRPDKTRRGLGCDLKFIGKESHQFRRRVVPQQIIF